MRWSVCMERKGLCVIQEGGNLSRALTHTLTHLSVLQRRSVNGVEGRGEGKVRGLGSSNQKAGEESQPNRFPVKGEAQRWGFIILIKRACVAP